MDQIPPSSSPLSPPDRPFPSSPPPSIFLPRYDRPYLWISVPEQKMQLRREDQILATYTISTSKFGLGFCEGTFQTPLGRFYICEKIGAEAALGEIFQDRLATGTIATLGGEGDLITTRILWLAGLDPDNTNTRERYIYIHGTNQENLLGQPASNGCIRMSNAEIQELFDRIETNAPVFIFDSPFDILRMQG